MQSNYTFIKEGKNLVKISAEKNKSLILVNIKLDCSFPEDLKILSKFTIEDKLEEIIEKENILPLENRIVVVFSIANENSNLISEMILEGINSIIQVIAIKHIYTNKDVITIKYQTGISEVILNETIEFLLTPGISKVMHSSVIELKNDNFNNKQKNSKAERKAFSLVTGGGRGIGAGASRVMAEEGHNLILTGRKLTAETQAHLEELKKYTNITAEFFELDIGDPLSIKFFVENLKEKDIYLKCIIHNAGVGSQTSEEQTNINKDANAVLIEVNSIGTVRLQEELEKSGMLLDPCRVLLVNSVGGIRPFKEFKPIDQASKAVLKTFATNLAKKEGLSAISIYPGATNTDMFKKSTLEPLEKTGETEAFISKLPKKRIIDPLEIGKIIAFFVRDDISLYTNGASIHASCGMNLDYRELPKSEQKPEQKSAQKLLTLPEAHFLCVKEAYDPINSPEGRINFGTSQNYIMSKNMVKYLPSFLTEHDLHYSSFSGTEEFRKILSINTGYEYNETIATHSLESAIDLVCHQFKKVFIQNKTGFNIQCIISHSQVSIVDKLNSECNIFIFPDEAEIQALINQADKFTLIVLNKKSQLVYNQNKYILYAYKSELSNSFICGVIHFTNNQLAFKDMIFYLTSNVLQAAACKQIDLPVKHNITNSLQQMLKKNDNVDIAEQNIYLFNKSTKALDSLAKTLFEKDNFIGIDTPLYPGFLVDLIRNGAKLLFNDDEEKSLVGRVLEAKQSGAKGYLICNPVNPTGKVYEKEEIEALCQWARSEENFYLIFDELYAYSNYSEEKKFHSAIQYTNSNPNIFIVRGFAKDFGLSGFYVGFVISTNEKIKANFESWKPIQEPHPATLAVVDELLKNTNYGSDLILMNIKLLKQAVHTSTKLLDEMGIQYIKPHAGLFVMVDLERFMKDLKINTEIEFFSKLFNDYGLNVSPGGLFKFKKIGMYRLCLMYDDATITEGLLRLRKFLNI